MSRRLSMSRPTVGSSRTRSCGRCSRARRDLDPALHAAAERPDLAAGALGQAQPAQHLGDPRLRPRHAVQRGGIAQVLVHAQVEIEGRALEHDAHRRQRRAGRRPQRVAAHGDAAGLGREQARDQRHQRALAGAVRPEQGREPAGRCGEAHLVQGLDGAGVAVADRLHLQRRVAHPVPAFPAAVAPTISAGTAPMTTPDRLRQRRGLLAAGAAV